MARRALAAKCEIRKPSRMIAEAGVKETGPAHMALDLF